MPDINFVLPHWLYWFGIFVFPLIAIYMARRVKERDTSCRIDIAYFVWLVGGFIGLHRFYVRSLFGVVFCALFSFILYASHVENQARIIYSDAVAGVDALENSLKRHKKTIEKNNNLIVEQREKLKTIDQSDTNLYERDKKKLDKLVAKRENAVAKIEEGTAELERYKQDGEDASLMRSQWGDYSFYAFLSIVLLMLVDLFYLPKAVKRVNRDLAKNPPPEVERPETSDDSDCVSKKKGFTQLIDKISLYSGEYAAYWGVIAVFVYYYEVTVRYVFNSPTNWAHEAMFLMFGMQYLIAGSYAYLTGSHVRVDIFYAKFSTRMKAMVDIATSVFFFIFAGTLLVTGLIFALDSLQQNEVSFTEWGIQYWPIKFGLVVGALLLLLQGVSKLLKDIAIVVTNEA